MDDLLELLVLDSDLNFGAGGTVGAGGLPSEGVVTCGLERRDLGGCFTGVIPLVSGV